MWRERLRNAFTEVAQGRSFVHPSENVDELNDAELPEGIGTPLADAAARSDHLLGELIDLYQELGEQPFKWYAATNTTEAGRAINRRVGITIIHPIAVRPPRK